MQESNSIRIGGAVTYWTVAKFVNLAALKANLDAVGWGKFVPPPRTTPAALRDALEEVFPSRAYRVEPLRDKNAFEVIEIFRGDQRNTYDHHLWVGVDKDRAVEIKPFDAGKANQIVHAFNKHLGLVRANNVSQSLLAILANLNGTSLKSGGHIYWLPVASLEKWRDVAHAVEGARSQGGATRVQLLQHQLDAEEVRAVRDGIVDEVRDEAARMHAEIMTGDLGEKALEFRKERLRQLAEKIGLYEGLLDTGLGDLREQLAVADEAAVTATLLLSSGAAKMQPA